MITSPLSLTVGLLLITTTETSPHRMWSFDEAPGRDAATPGNNQEGGNQWEASHNRRPLLGDPVKPCQRARAIVKGQTERENRWRAIDTDWRSYAEVSGARDAVRELSASFELLLRRCVQNRHHRGVKRIWEHHILCSWSVPFRHSVDFTQWSVFIIVCTWWVAAGQQWEKKN